MERNNMTAWYAYHRHLRELGCPRDVEECLLESIRWPENATADTPILYVSGKMRGLPDLGFPHFDAAKAIILASGRACISPADMDRGWPLPEDWSDVQKARAYMRRDWWAIYGLSAEHRDGLFLLDNWKDSIGATAERALARWSQLTIYGKIGAMYGGKPILELEAECLVS
jgi:hypothetical protein